MSECSDEFVPATPDSTPVRPLQYKMFQYLTPQNSPGFTRLARCGPISFPSASGAGVAPQATGQILPKSKGGPGPASRRKLPFPPKRKQFGRKKVDFKNALFKVLRKIDPTGTISSKAMTVLNDMMCDLLERLCKEAESIRERNGKTTLKTRDIQTAARILLPGQLFSHAFYEGHRCLAKLLEHDRKARERADA